MPSPDDSSEQQRAFSDVFLKWQASVRQHYYQV
jgi:hypothetical protein